MYLLNLMKTNEVCEACLVFFFIQNFISIKNVLKHCPFSHFCNSTKLKIGLFIIFCLCSVFQQVIINGSCLVLYICCLSFKKKERENDTFANLQYP